LVTGPTKGTAEVRGPSSSNGEEEKARVQNLKNDNGKEPKGDRGGKNGKPDRGKHSHIEEGGRREFGNILGEVGGKFESGPNGVKNEGVSAWEKKQQRKY